MWTHLIMWIHLIVWTHFNALKFKRSTAEQLLCCAALCCAVLCYCAVLRCAVLPLLCRAAATPLLCSAPAYEHCGNCTVLQCLLIKLPTLVPVHCRMGVSSCAMCYQLQNLSDIPSRWLNITINPILFQRWFFKLLQCRGFSELLQL